MVFGLSQLSNNRTREEFFTPHGLLEPRTWGQLFETRQSVVIRCTHLRQVRCNKIDRDPFDGITYERTYQCVISPGMSRQGNHAEGIVPGTIALFGFECHA